MNITTKNKIYFSDFEIETFKIIVLNANQVSKKSFDSLFKKKPIILIAKSNDSIEAVGALKIPHENYKKKVFQNSLSPENHNNYTYELGWIVSLVKGVGYGKKITEVLSKNSSNIYATVREENYKMRHILNLKEFIQSGVHYKSERGDYYNILYIKNNKSSKSLENYD